MTVPQVGHLPLMALRPFFMVSSTALEISFLALHLTQYPSGIRVLPLNRFMQFRRPATLRVPESGRQQGFWPPFMLQLAGEEPHFRPWLQAIPAHCSHATDEHHRIQLQTVPGP
jgi:hypothetical protein